MSLESVRTTVVSRLGATARADHGWWLLTRVHLTTGRLNAMASYLDDAGFRTSRALSARDYAALAEVAGIQSDDPGVVLRRHHLLAMVTPLSLLRRSDGRTWAQVELTAAGHALATEADSVAVLESALLDIVFCRTPWYTATRVAEYHEFDVHPYDSTLKILAECDGWIDRDEYDLFVSRIRLDAEIGWAADGIRQFRELAPDERTVVLDEVRNRVPSDKTYQNWRDMGLHTFSLFSLGSSMLRVGTRLVLAGTDDGLTASDRVQEIAVASGLTAAKPPTARVARSRIELRVPAVDDDSGLATPPIAAAANNGSDGELLVGKLLEADGWTVVYYTHRRGFGFDIWARRGDEATVVEVKSSLQEVASLTLTKLEYEVALHYGPNYVLAIVERLGTDAPSVYLVADPAAVLAVEERSTTEYQIGRSNWISQASILQADEKPGTTDPQGI